MFPDRWRTAAMPARGCNGRDRPAAGICGVGDWAGAEGEARTAHCTGSIPAGRAGSRRGPDMSDGNVQGCTMSRAVRVVAVP